MTKEHYEHFGEEIKRRRESWNLSMDYVFLTTGVSQRMQAYLELLIVKQKMKQADILADYYGMYYEKWNPEKDKDSEERKIDFKDLKKRMNRIIYDEGLKFPEIKNEQLLEIIKNNQPE